MAKHTEILPEAERVKYARQLALSQFGAEGQMRLKKGSVLVVGAGGLGCPALLYLAAAGVGRIGIADGDEVEAHNLHRQVLYTEADTSRKKALAAAERIQNRNSLIKTEPVPERLTSQNARQIIRNYDVVIDATDNFASRYLINDACFFEGKPFIYASIYRYEGQLSVFNFCGDGESERGPDYRDLFPDPPPPELSPDCSEAGVLGVLPGLFGSMQAVEAIKILTGIGDPLSGRLLMKDLLTMHQSEIEITKREDHPLRGQNPRITELIDYEAFCSPLPENVEQIQPGNLEEVLNSPERPVLIDVRETHERRNGHLGGINIPMDRLKEKLPDYAHKDRIVFYCETGNRSLSAASRAAELFNGNVKVASLEGGFVAASKVNQDLVQSEL